MDIGKVINLDKNENLVLFNTIYHSNIDNDRKRDAISLVFKDMDTGKKVLREIENPNIEVYKAKPHVDLGDINHITIEREKLDRFDIQYNQKVLELAKLLGKEAEDYYWNCVKSKNFKETNKILMDNRLFACDRNIEDFYRYKCYNYFGEKELSNTRKGFFDIEADIMYGDIDFDNSEGEAPVNVVTLVDADSMTSYTLILRDDNNPLIADFEKDIPNFLRFMNDKYDDDIGHFDYKIAMFDTEIELIEFLFVLINTINLDFLLAWNMGFDIPYLIHRIKRNGKNPADIICHPDFNFKQCKYRKSNEFEIKKKTDWFTVSAYTVYMDQMINYASVRKSQAKLDSYKLDFIGNKEVNAGKLDYSDLGSIKEFPYKDFKRYVEYNIIDCMTQYRIEKKVNDVDTVFYRSYEANTRLNKVFKEVTFLTNVAYKEFKDFQGLVLGNNINALLYDEQNKEKEEKFSGAFVGDPLLIDYVGKLLFRSTYSKNIFDNIVDYDYTSLYPTITMLFNIFKTTLLGKLILQGKSTVREAYSENIFEKGRYDRGGQYMEDLETQEALFFCYKWLNLPSIEDTINQVYSKLEKQEVTSIVKIKKKEKVKKKVIRIKKKKVV